MRLHWTGSRMFSKKTLLGLDDLICFTDKISLLSTVSSTEGTIKLTLFINDASSSVVKMLLRPCK